MGHKAFHDRAQFWDGVRTKVRKRQSCYLIKKVFLSRRGGVSLPLMSLFYENRVGEGYPEGGCHIFDIVNA